MPKTYPLNSNDYPFLKGGGEMGKLTRTFKWDDTTIGSPAFWPQSLKTTLSILLNSKFPMFLWWGSELTCFYNDAYRPSLGENGKHPSILGMPAIDAWPEIWDTIHPLIEQVLGGGEATWAEDQLIPIFRNGQMEDVYWTFSYSPVIDESERVTGVLVTCSETTGKVLAAQQLEQQNEQLQHAIAAENLALRKIRENEKNLRQVILQAPVAIAIFRGADYEVEIANTRALELWGRKLADVVHKPILESMPELKDQGVKALLDNVYQTGNPFSATELPVEMFRSGKMETAYVNFVYEPLYNTEGQIDGLITIGSEVTASVLAREKIQAANEEMLSANEELLATNEELAETQKHLEATISNLATSESRFRFLVQGAPVAIGVLTGRNMVIESANDLMLQVWGKNKTIIGKALAVALPELQGQPYLQLLDNVYTSGRAYYGNEAMVKLEHKGELKDLYFNFIYQPLNDSKSGDNIIMVVAVEVTAQVYARIELQRAEEMLRFSVEAAGVATWYMDASTRELNVSARLKDIFGFHPDAKVSYDDILNRIPEEYHDSINAGIAIAVANGDSYTMEHPITGYDGKIRWVRAVGKLYPAAGKRRAHVSGLIIDITEQKQDELRKNDFIGMVSHELKTPLTTLTALVQVLNAKLKNSDDNFIAGALDKANVQVKKMSSMINGFLNISRLESGKIVVNKQLFNFDELITEMIDETRLTVSSHNINFSPCSPAIRVYADRDKIGSVISNLLSNAVKYSPKGKNIDVRCEIIKHKLRLSVKDEGMGVKPHDIDKLFDRYYRVESQHTTHISGFGIGLYLSAEIIHRHDGKIWVESESGRGSTFYFDLPAGG